MSSTVLTVPGYHGSGQGHWQTWLESEVADSRRVKRIDWDSPILADWALEIRREIDEAVGAVWIVAHSFGCLATVVAVCDRMEKVAGVILVAPADPLRFSPLGHGDLLKKGRRQDESSTIRGLLPTSNLGIMGALIASRNDPWMPFSTAHELADTWGLALHDAGDAGHINVESGHGPWPFIKLLLLSLRKKIEIAPLIGTLDDEIKRRGGRGSVLASVRNQTRRKIEYF